MIKVNGMGWNSTHENFAVDYVGEDYAVVLYSNKMSVTIADKELTALPGACVILPVGCRRHYRGVDKYWADDWVAFESADEDVPRMLESLGLPVEKLFYPQNPTYISSMIDNIGSEFIQSLPHREFRLDALVRLLLAELSRRKKDLPQITDSSKEDRERVVEVRRMMLENLRKRWTVSQLAELSYLSHSRFHQLYKELFSTSPKQDLIAARVKEAKFLLESGDYTVSKAAYEVGYENIYQFIRQFSAMEGRTPGEYLKLL